MGKEVTRYNNTRGRPMWQSLMAEGQCRERSRKSRQTADVEVPGAMMRLRLEWGHARQNGRSRGKNHL